jgi:hypothetical protein
MSAAARRKISLAQKERWGKATGTETYADDLSGNGSRTTRKTDKG